MQEDAIKWNARYKQHFMPHKPSSFVLEACKLLQDTFFSHPTPNAPLAVDIACGNGRNAKILSQLGFEVEAIDISSVALESLANIPRITPILADLDNFSLAQKRYDVLLNSLFLDRRLFAPMIASLKPNAIVLFETYIIPDSKFKDYVQDSHYTHTSAQDRISPYKTLPHKTLPNKALCVGELEYIFSEKNGFTTLYTHIYKTSRKNAPFPHLMQFIAHYKPNN